MRYSPAGISKKFSQIVSEVLTQIQLLFKKEGLEFSFDEDEFEKLVMDWRKNLLDTVQF
ncbi:TPA: hypothetical protein LY824_002577 [Enterococcus faecium]|nr:hypothetical protein [Enterococcus faecium]HBM6632373.1 hypothetical protein [Enterococcus faecium]